MHIVEVSDNRLSASKEIENTFSDNVADQMQRSVYSKNALFNSLDNSLKLHKLEAERAHTIIGRVLSLFSKPLDPEKMMLDGMRLHQCFDLAGETPPLEIHVGKQYQVDLVSLERLVDQAKANGRFGR
ncbi:MAG: hypothetical protein AAGA76_01190 [Pseudomonadota bacterium]